jgi:hypothetical protein
MNYINLTPHPICMNDGRQFHPSGKIARVQASFSDVVDDVCVQQFGDVQDLPAPQDGVCYIVSAMVLSACDDRDDVVAPATGHPDTMRNDKGHIISVPGFVRG